MRFASQLYETPIDRCGGLGRDLLADNRTDQRAKAVDVRFEPAGADAVDDSPQVRVDPSQVFHGSGPAILRVCRRRGSGSFLKRRETDGVCIHQALPWSRVANSLSDYIRLFKHILRIQLKVTPHPVAAIYCLG